MKITFPPTPCMALNTFCSPYLFLMLFLCEGSSICSASTIPCHVMCWTLMSPSGRVMEARMGPSLGVLGAEEWGIAFLSLQCLGHQTGPWRVKES